MKNFIRSFVVAAALLFLASCNGGSSNPYITLNYPGGIVGGSTYLTGIRGIGDPFTTTSNVYISGIYPSTTEPGAFGLLYVGSIDGSGTWYTLSYPSSPGATVQSTALYGPNNGTRADEVQIVGNYTTSEVDGTIGLLYEGSVDGSGTWTTLNPQVLEPTRTVKNIIAHSTMGGFVVGNYDTDIATGKAFIYDIENGTFFHITKPGAVSITAYGIWDNGDGTYTITGGFSNTDDGGISTAYLADWDPETQTVSNWQAYTYQNQSSVLTHFEGITTDGERGYNLVADSVVGPSIIASFVNIPRNSNGTFGAAAWTDYSYPGSTITSANTVFENYVLGIYQTGDGISNGYVITIP